MLELLKKTEIHPSADWLYDQLKREFPHLSMGTVYRNLQILADQGLVRRIDFGSTFDRFDAHVEPHYHFVCERCGSIFDLDIPIKPELNTLVEGSSPYRVSHHKIQFYGLCDACDESRESTSP